MWALNDGKVPQRQKSKKFLENPAKKKQEFVESHNHLYPEEKNQI